MTRTAPVENVVWVLPRPRRDKYAGGFPLHFEKKLLRLYGEPEKVFHPFGGHAEFGLRLDIRRDEAQPDIVGDAHFLPIADNVFDFTIVDPPFSDKEAKDIFGTKKIKPSVFVREAVRVTKPGGYIALYHKCMMPRPEGTTYDKRVFVGTRVWHLPRICCVFRKD